MNETIRLRTFPFLIENGTIAGYLVASARTGSVLTEDNRIGSEGKTKLFPTVEAAKEFVSALPQTCRRYEFLKS